jgi:citrate synthase
MALSFVAQSARGAGQPPVPQTEVDKGTTIPERFLIRWRGEATPTTPRRSTPTGSPPPSTA